jgi:hypothetical protein
MFDDTSPSWLILKSAKKLVEPADHDAGEDACRSASDLFNGVVDFAVAIRR